MTEVITDNSVDFIWFDSKIFCYVITSLNFVTCKRSQDFKGTNSEEVIRCIYMSGELTRCLRFDRYCFV